MTLAALRRRLESGELTPREAVQSFLERIEALQPTLNAFISVQADAALAEADQLERSPAGQALWGVPVAVKDVIDVAGAPTTAASKILAGHIARRDAAVAERLKAAGAIIVGKLNTHEFAYGAMTTSPHFGPARNPWDTERICGGSSGGSGAAIAAGLVPGTLGTDTAGSIRIPSCFCGATGLRPSIGLVSNRGVVPVSWTFDTVGPIARTAEDCSLLLDALAPQVKTSTQLGEGVRGLKIGVVRALFDEDTDSEIAMSVNAAVEELRSLGAEVRPVEIPLLDKAGTIQQMIMLPEAAAAHVEWLRTRLPDYGADVRARLLAGLLLPATAYATGTRARRFYDEGLTRVLAEVDLLAAPTMPITPPRIGEDTVKLNGRDVPYRLSFIRFLSPWSLAGLPVASVPCGFVRDLPVALALVGRPFEEGTVLRAAHAFQLATDWHERRPELSAAV